MKTINFIKYLKKYQVKTSQEITTLEESISFQNSTGEVEVYYNKPDFTLTLEPYYKDIKYSEIDLELTNVENFRFSSNGKEIKFKEAYSYGSLGFLKLTKTGLTLDFTTDNNDVVQVALSYEGFYIDYDKSGCLSFSLIDYLHKLERNNKLFAELCETVDDDMLKSISEADYGYGAKECFVILKQIQQTQCLPKKPDFDLEEVLSLTCFGRSSNRRDKIEFLFSATCLLSADYQNDGPIEYRLIKLLIESTVLESRESLLAYYLNYLHTKHTYENPNLLLALLIITTMCFLGCVKEDIVYLLDELEETNFLGCYEYSFIPDGTFEDFNFVLRSLPNKKNSARISNMLENMFKKTSTGISAHTRPLI